jgi:hypothetical protein
MSSALRRLFAPLTLAVFLCTLALPLFPGAHVTWDDDEDGAPGMAPERYAMAVIQPPAASPIETHCALCHWLHALAGATVGQSISTTPGFVNIVLVQPVPTRSPVQPTRTHGASRAPPAPLAV